MAMMFEWFTTDPEVLGGVPCIRGLRVPVATVVGMVADGMPSMRSWPTSFAWKPRTSARPCGMPRERELHLPPVG
jgi:hypothetical protein